MVAGFHDSRLKITGTGSPGVRVFNISSTNRRVSVVFPAPGRPTTTSLPDGIRR
jgi:hypothetical protein